MPSKPFKIKERIKSFKPAIAGLAWLIKHEHNMRIHIFAAIVVVVISFIFNINNYQWMAVAICIGAVISAEAFNSAIEKLVDIISPNYNIKAGLIKDIASGAVLAISIVSAIVGFIIFIPKILSCLINL